MPLQPLRTFAEAARLKSFKKAADVLNVTPTAVSHQIRKLEEELGVALFERRVRSIALTPAGARLYPVIREAFGQVHDALEEIRAERHDRPLLMAATMAVSTLWIAPQVAAFRRAFPDVPFRLLASDDRVDLSAGEADFAVRFEREPDPSLDAVDLVAGLFAPVVAATLWPVHGNALANLPLLAFEWHVPRPGAPDWAEWWRLAGLGHFPSGRLIGFSDEAHAVQAALDGQGVLLANISLLRKELASGRLKQVPGPVLPHGRFRLVRARAKGSPRAEEAWHWWRQALVEAGKAAP